MAEVSKRADMAAIALALVAAQVGLIPVGIASEIIGLSAATYLGAGFIGKKKK